MKRLFSGAAFVVALLVSTRADAQGVLPLTFEGRAGIAFPRGEFPIGSRGGANAAETGVGFGGNASFNFLPGVAIYGGWDRYTFGADGEGILGSDEAEFVDEGFVVGGKLSMPIGFLTGFSPWVRGGALFRTLEVTGDEGTVQVGDHLKSSRSTGLEVGGGLEIPLGLVLSFTPGVIYRSFEPDFGETGADEKVSYLDVSLGLKVRL